MFDRPLHPQPFTLPRGAIAPSSTPFPLENAYHTPGQAAAIRFFDPYSDIDLEAMREILKGKQVRKWMDDARQISRASYRDWAGTDTTGSFLFAVLDAREVEKQALEYVRGFVYMYCEREEKFRVRRMERQGFIPLARGVRYSLEVSFAVRPLKDGLQSGSGLMSSALRQACLQVHHLLDSPARPEVLIFAFTDKENFPAQRTLEASGFVKKGLMKYDWDSSEETCLYILSKRLLQRKIREKMLGILQSKP